MRGRGREACVELLLINAQEKRQPGEAEAREHGEQVARETSSAELAVSTGFRPVVAGPLNAARPMESLAWLNMRIQMQSGGDWQSAVVILGAPPAAVAA